MTLFLLGACAQPDRRRRGRAPRPARRRASAARRAGCRRRAGAARCPPGGFVPARPARRPAPADGQRVRRRPGDHRGPGARDLSRPGPAQPAGPADLPRRSVQELVDKAVAAGVNGADFGRPGVADAPATEVTVRHRRRHADRRRDRRCARPGRDDPQLTEAQQRPARSCRVRRGARRPDRRAWPAPQPYQAGGARRAGPAVRRARATTCPSRPLTKAWPGPALPGEYLSPNLKIGCVTVTGAEHDEVLAAAEGRQPRTRRGRPGGQHWSVSFRPLLPDETGCADLKAARDDPDRRAVRPATGHAARRRRRPRTATGRDRRRPSRPARPAVRLTARRADPPQR